MGTFRALLLIVITVLLLTGCSRPLNLTDSDNTQISDHSDQYLSLQISKPNGNSYTTYKTINDFEVIKKIMLILQQADDSHAMVSMSRSPDFKFTLANTSPTVSSEPRIYGIWKSPNPKRIEVVSEFGGGGYVQLNQTDSKLILDLLK